MLNLNRLHVRTIAPAASCCVCVTGVILMILCTLGERANAGTVVEGDPNSLPRVEPAQASLDANTADPNAAVTDVPDPNAAEPNVTDPNTPDPNVADANTPDVDANSKRPPQKQAQTFTATGRLIEDSSTKNIHNLWRANIVSEFDPNDKGKTQLENLIAQINSIRLGQSATELTAEANAAPVVKIEPNEPLEKPVAKPMIQDPNIPGLGNAGDPNTSSAGQLAPETMAVFGKHVQDPNKMNEPFELAEILYTSGHFSEAAVAYQQALSRTDPNDSETSLRRAWILSQIGNCLRRTKPQEAMRSYQQLITDHPNSQWTEFAVAMNGILDWLDQDKPRDLIAEVQRLKAELSN
jgi:tetratricopeptide (TPR) repeat protein